MDRGSGAGTGMMGQGLRVDVAPGFHGTLAGTIGALMQGRLAVSRIVGRMGGC